jgi:hypothetical protein
MLPPPHLLKPGPTPGFSCRCTLIPKSKKLCVRTGASHKNQKKILQICDAKTMSALPPKADMCGATRDVRFGPKADICSAASTAYSITSPSSLASRSGFIHILRHACGYALANGQATQERFKDFWRT